jgi:hypothetical protein
VVLRTHAQLVLLHLTPWLSLRSVLLAKTGTHWLPANSSSSFVVVFTGSDICNSKPPAMKRALGRVTEGTFSKD